MSDIKFKSIGTGIETIEQFKQRVTNPLLPNRFTAIFSGNYFDLNSNKEHLLCKVNSASLPNYQTDSEEIYVGGTSVSVPSGLTKGNLELTIINQGIEYDILYQWMRTIYNENTRCYGYYDDVKADLYITQYHTNGIWALQYHFYGCTPYNLQIDQISYSAANDFHSFSIALNYFSYTSIYNNTNQLNIKKDYTISTLEGTRKIKNS